MKKEQKIKGSDNNDTLESANELEGALASSDSSLEAVRDILFGAQIRETDKQRSNLEKQLKNLISTLEDQSKERFQSLNKEILTLRKEVDAAAEKNTGQLNKKIDQLNTDLSAALQELDKTTSAADIELSDQLSTSVNAISTQMEQWKVDILSELDSAHSQLLHDKTDRQTLSALFANLSDQLLSEKKSKK